MFWDDVHRYYLKEGSRKFLIDVALNYKHTTILKRHTYIYVHISHTNFRNLPLEQKVAIGKRTEWQKGPIRGRMAFLCSIWGTITRSVNNKKRPKRAKDKHALRDIASGLYAWILNFWCCCAWFCSTKGKMFFALVWFLIFLKIFLAMYKAVIVNAIVANTGTILEQMRKD